MSRSIFPWQLGLAMMTACGCASSGEMSKPLDARWALSVTPLDRSAAQLDNDTAEHLAWAKTYRKRLLGADGPRTIANTLVPYNQMMMHLDASKNECELLARVHPDEGVRMTAEEGEQEAAKYLTELKLDRDLYAAFQALDVSGADDATQFLVHKILRDFRRAGVDQPTDTRRRAAALNDDIVKLGQAFAKNTREDQREILLDSPAELDGLPADWIEKHQPQADGKIHVSTKYPDYAPFMTYARNATARKAIYQQFKNRGYPQNIETLDQLIAKRHELATLLGYPHWAAYATEDKMIETAERARAFIDKITETSRGPALRDYTFLLEQKKRDDPNASKVADWEKGYYERQVKAERFSFDPQAVRPYFNFRDVLSGLFDLTQKLFGVTYRKVEGVKLWHEDVTAWDVFEGEKQLGRFYLDLHPRENKYGHAAQFDYRTGIAGVRLPQAALVCNFPNPRSSSNGVALMEHDDVVTLFHEFGHLLHTIFSGHRKWMGNSGINTEWDFVEAPSQMLEEWCYDVDALRLFAKHYETGRPIPGELVENLRRAADFGKGLYAAHQMFYAAVSLNYYNRDPQDLDTTDLLMELQDVYSPFDYEEGTHFQCSFGHLDHYSAFYYTYMWSKVIAKDLFSKFEREGVLNTDTSRHYRKTILDPGGSKKAGMLIEDFLGRPYSFDAYKTWLRRM
jgi:thimet oligopeptidase